jgi:hypothetical protein
MASGQPGFAVAWGEPPAQRSQECVGGLAPGRSSLRPVLRSGLRWDRSRRCAVVAPITMAVCSVAAAAAVDPLVGRAEQDPFLLLESCRRAIEALLRGQGLAGQAGGPLHRSWISHPYGEEEITLLEEEVLPVIAACLERVREIDGSLLLR